MRRSRSFWITWESQRRNRELSAALGIPLYEFSEVDRISFYPLKYLFGITKTLGVLLKNRPEVVFCQNPSVVLATTLVWLGKIFGFATVVDQHNAGLNPAQGKHAFLNRLANYVQKNADCNIISNAGLAVTVKSNSGTYFVLPDKIPLLPEVPSAVMEAERTFLFICTFADDEPYLEVFAAAAKIPANWQVLISGNFNKAGVDPTVYSDNVVFTGFVSEERFVQLLKSVDVIIDLTTRQNCLVCGAYEAVAAQTPMILSDTEALRSYFHAGAEYTGESAEQIAQAMRNAIGRLRDLQDEICQLSRELNQSWSEQFDELKARWLPEKK